MFMLEIGLIDIGVRDRGQGGGNCPRPKFWKTMEILANARKNQENSGRFIRKYVKIRSFHYNSP
jgi:hypothetical protein